VTGANDLNQLAVGEVLDRLAAEFGPIAEWLDGFRRGVATEKDATITLAD
jgi:hypothetical protein